MITERFSKRSFILALLLGLSIAFAMVPAARAQLPDPSTLMIMPEPPPPEQSFKTLLLSSKSPSYNITPSVQVFKVKKGEKIPTFAEILPRFRAGEGEAVEGEKIFLGYERSGAWLVFNVYNRSQAKSRWVLDFGSYKSGTIGIADRVMFYTDADASRPLIDDGKHVKNKIHLPGQERNAAPLTLEPGRNITIGIFIKAAAGMPLALNMKMHEQASFAAERNRLSLENNIILGIIIAACAVFLGFWASYRKTLPLILITYLLARYGFFLTSDEIISFGNNSRVEQFDLMRAIASFAALSLCTQVLFAVDKKSKLHHGLTAAKILIAGLALFGLLVESADPVTGTILNRYIPTAVVFIATALSVHTFFFHRERPQSGLFMASWLLLLPGIVFSEFTVSGVAGYSTGAVGAYWICVLLHISLISFATLRFLIEEEDARQRAEAERRHQMEEEQELRNTREQAEQSRLLGVMQREKELVSDLRNREAERIQALRHAKEVADQANRAKTDFLAVISHEIRTPMTGIMGMVRLLLDTQMTEKQREYASTIQYSGDALLTLLNDILDLSKAEEGKMTLEIVDFDLRRMAESVNMLMSGRAEEKNLTLKLDFDPETPTILKGDPTRLRQILLNLVNNALKFTDKGGVTVTIRPHEKAGKKPRIYFSITDTGIGISEEAQKKLFNPYSQADASISRNFGGTGLGLAICKRLVEAMGSTIQVSSEPGRGTTFYFILSLDYGTEVAAEKAESRIHVPPMRILVVDDNSINQKVAAGLLEKDGHAVIAVGAAEAAFEKIRKNTFDVVLMDVEMPGTDGIAATKIIRSLADPEKSRLPIIAMTGHTGSADIERCREAGMNDHVSKPISPEGLRKTLARFASNKLGPGVTTPVPSSPEARSSSTYTPAPVQPSAPAAPAPNIPGAQKFFNQEVLGSLKDSLGKAQMDEMMDGLYQKTEELIAAIEKAATDGDIATISMRGHDIKGMTSNFGLTALSELAGRLEKQAKEKAPIESLAEQAQRLRPIYYDTRSVLDKWLKS